MYHPYFRGRQYELIAIRESAPILAEKNFVPIIEPVNERLSSLEKTLDRLCDEDARVILIMNPQIGDHSDNSTNLRKFINEHYHEQQNLIYGFLLAEETFASEAIELCEAFDDKEIALIHAGFSQAKELSKAINNFENVDTSIFFEGHCGKLYQRHFADHSNRILIRDGFERRRNRDYPPTEFFSDLHATFRLEGMDGFGDFLIVGDQYSENGGPAYTVTIHLTYIDSDKDDEMHIRHFKSDRQDTPKDPAGKFAEALEKLISALDQGGSKILETDAVVEFRDFHETGHYPGLGYLKKLSMKHHIETLANFFDE